MKKILEHLKKNWIRHCFETMVVVAGILIAFYLDNWNEQRKNNILEIQYMERLVEDLKADTTYYGTRIAYTKKAVDQLYTFIHEIYKTQMSIEEVKNLFGYLILNTDHLASQNSTYRELISSGKFDLIQNQVLKKSITDYYWLNEDMAIQIQEFNLVSTELLVEAFRTVRNMNKYTRMDVQIVNGVNPYDDPQMFLEDEWKFINDPSSEKFQALEAMVFIYWFRFNEHLEFFTKLNSNSKRLNSQIKEELKARK